MRTVLAAAVLVAFAAQAQPGNPAIHAYTLLKQGKLDEAEAIFSGLYKKEPPELNGLLGLIEVAVARKAPDRALALIEEGRQKWPNDPNLDVAWAAIAARSGRVAEAIPVLERLTQANPGSFELAMRLADYYRQKGDLPSAIETWEKASGIQPKNVTPVLYRAMSLEALGRTREAAPLYEDVLKLDPDNLIALNNYSFYLAERNIDFKSAERYARHAMELAPTQPMVADSLGFVLIRSHQSDKAIAHYRAQVAKYPKVAIFHIHLAESLLLANDAAAAKKELATAAANLTDAERAEWKRVSAKLGNSPTQPRVR